MRVLLLAAITVDGKIARDAHELSNWTSREDKRIFVRTTRESGVLIMGRSTYETLPGPLLGRHHVILTTRPPADTPEEVEFTDAAPAEVLSRLAERGYSTVVVAGGASVYRQFLAAGLVDELWLTIEPLTFGAGVGLLGDGTLELRLSLLSSEVLNGQSIHLRYRVQRDGEGA